MCQCANTTAGCEHQKQRKQKQQNRNNTQHMIIVYIHPLPFRSIAVCIGVRTAILHRCSHLTFIPPSCIGVRTFHFSIAVRCLEFVVHLSLEQFAAYHGQQDSALAPPRPTGSRVHGRHLLLEHRLGTVF